MISPCRNGSANWGSNVISSTRAGTHDSQLNRPLLCVSDIQRTFKHLFRSFSLSCHTIPVTLAPSNLNNEHIRASPPCCNTDCRWAVTAAMQTNCRLIQAVSSNISIARKKYYRLTLCPQHTISIKTSYYFAQLITEALVHRVLEKSKLSNSWRQLLQLLGLCGSWLHTVLEHGRPLT